ncbi:MucBP domain-containing protein [uncultured Vagococcus sp.]|uniref:MucBP domain-containing protein n=1 Tax=uncultured Vagococcus sp. TaxID=189676 RepID=UPI0028D7FD20|nr:MucBP domain-containing protein [uncultured Vagococcus sp.]
MKRLAFALLTSLTLFSLLTSNSAAEENTESTNTTPSTTEPSSETPPTSEEMATITFTYIDVDTNQEIASSKSVTDKLGTTIMVDVKAIPGYQVSDVMLVREVDILSTDYTFPIRYVKDPVASSTTSVSNQGPAETTPSSNTVVAEEPTSSSSLPISNTTVEGDVENNTTDLTIRTYSTTNSSSSNVKTLETSSSSNKTTNLSSKEKKLTTAKKTSGFLPKAGSKSNSILIVIGLMTMIASISAYSLLKKTA